MSFLLAEQNTMAALRYADYGYILENGRVVMDGDAKDLAPERGREGVLPRTVDGGPQEFSRREALPPPQDAGSPSRPQLARAMLRCSGAGFTCVRLAAALAACLATLFALARAGAECRDAAQPSIPVTLP